jgi:hypothetical protein
MAQKDYTYENQGVTAAYLAQQVPGTGTVSPAVPARLQTITWDETYKDDLDYAMASAGWVFAYEGVSPPALTIAQIQPTFLAADASLILVASGWVDVLTKTITTIGGTSIGSQITALGAPAIGVGQARLVVDGGSYSNQVMGAAAYDIPLTSQGGVAFHIPTPIPDTSPNLTTYTFKLQMQATGILGTLTPRKGTGLTLLEYR